MKKVVALGVCWIIAVEILVIAALERSWLPVLSGVIVALTLVAVFRLPMRTAGAPPAPDTDDRTESLDRWLSRTQTLVNRAGSTRREWDRHLRPMLARQFEMATDQRQARDRAAFAATGRMLFGPQLWAWVDPDGIATDTGDEPGPGRAVLDEILTRLERI